VTAAGNGQQPAVNSVSVGVNACGNQLDVADGVINVGATDSDDKQAPFSNFGPCVDREWRLRDRGVLQRVIY
jgi:hypothetical protein